MAAYVIVDVDIADPTGYEEYRRIVGPTIAAYGGRFLVRAGQFEQLEGEWLPRRLVVLEFESLDRAREWYNSDLYRVPKLIRQQASSANMILVEGV